MSAPSLSQLYREYVSHTEPACRICITRDGPLMKKIFKKLLEWVSRHKEIVIVGGTSVDLIFRHHYGEKFYDDDNPGDLDIKMSENIIVKAILSLGEVLRENIMRSMKAKFEWSFLPFSSTIEQRLKERAVALDAKKKKGEKGEEVELHLAGSLRRPLPGARALIKVGDVIIAEVGILSAEMINTLPTIEVPIEAKKKNSPMVKVVTLEYSLSAYFGLISSRRLIQRAAKMDKLFDYVERILKVMKPLPRPLQIKTIGEIEKSVKELKERIPLPKGCYYAGQTSLSVLEGKPIGEDAVVEIACFEDSTTVMRHLIEKGKYESFEMSFPWEWHDRPARIHLQPSEKGINPLVIYDCSILCGQTILKDILSPINSGGYCLSLTIATKVGATLLERNGTLISLLLGTEENVGKCLFGSWITRQALHFGVDRFEYVSAIRYLGALVEKMRSRRKSKES